MVGMDGRCERTAVAAGRLGLDGWTDRVQQRILANPGCARSWRLSWKVCVLPETRVANGNDRSLNVRFFPSLDAVVVRFDFSSVRLL